MERGRKPSGTSLDLWFDSGQFLVLTRKIREEARTLRADMQERARIKAEIDLLESRQQSAA